MTKADFSSEGDEGALRKHPALLVTDCKRLYDASHKDGADPSSTDKLPIELAIVKSHVSDRRLLHRSMHRSSQKRYCSRWQSHNVKSPQKKRCWTHGQQREKGQKGLVRQRMSALRPMFLEGCECKSL